MQKIILVIACLCGLVLVKAQPNISRVEYFFNTDPGFGSGIAFPISPSPDIKDFTAPISLTDVPDGINSFFIRSRDANGKWSITNRFIFVRTNVPATNNITAAEYFFDTDPGFGKASAISISPGIDVANISVSAEMGDLTLGLHSLYIRSRAASGKWSITNRFLLVKAAAQPELPNITGVEYFIDTDPGFGKGVPVAINPATNLPDFVMNVNITGLSAGTHRLYLRSRNATGNWSITNIYSFPIATPAAAPLIAVNSLTQKKLCGSNQFVLAYDATGTYTKGNVFSVQLSNATGSFTSPQVIGTLAATASGLIDCTIPLQIPNGSSYKIRVVSSNPAVTGLISDTLFTLFRQPRYADTLAPIVCAGETLNLNTVFNTTGFTTVWNSPSPTVAPTGLYQLITSNTAFCKDTTLVTVQQDTARWIGAVSADWHNPSNWNIGRVPNAKTHVTISGNTPNACIISTADAQAASVRAKNGGILRTTNSHILVVTGSCDPSTLPPN